MEASTTRVPMHLPPAAPRFSPDWRAVRGVVAGAGLLLGLSIAAGAGVANAGALSGNAGTTVLVLLGTVATLVVLLSGPVNCLAFAVIFGISGIPDHLANLGGFDLTVADIFFA